MLSIKRKYLILMIYTIILPSFLLAEREVFIDLSVQKIYAIEDGKTLFEGKISSGKQGHETPTGIFKILQKERMHISNLYPAPHGGAKMPYMMRLTWDGVAMHQGYVNNRPASHGCIRLQRKLAQKLFYWVDKGTKVTIAGDINRYSNNNLSYIKDEDGYSVIEIY